MSLWEEGLANAEPSFRVPIPDITSDPASGPYVSVQFNQDWLLAVCGCILQLCQPPSWAVSDPTELAAVLERATALINIFMGAEGNVVQEIGTASGTILAGTNTVLVPITFSLSHSSPPIVIVSGKDLETLAWVSDITETTCNVHMTVATNVVADTPSSLDWAAFS